MQKKRHCKIRDEIGVGMQPMLSPNVIPSAISCQMSVSWCQQVMDEWIWNDHGHRGQSVTGSEWYLVIKNVRLISWKLSEGEMSTSFIYNQINDHVKVYYHNIKSCDVCNNLGVMMIRPEAWEPLVQVCGLRLQIICSDRLMCNLVSALACWPTVHWSG